MTNPRSVVAALLFVCIVATPVVAQERPVAGRIKVSTGAAFIVRDGAQIPAQLGQTVFEADGLRTGGDGKIGVTLNDDTSAVPRPEQRAQTRTLHVRASRQRLRFGAASSSGARRPTCRVALRSSRPTRSASKRRRPSSACEGRRWRSAYCRSERRPAVQHVAGDRRRLDRDGVRSEAESPAPFARGRTYRVAAGLRHPYRPGPPASRTHPGPSTLLPNVMRRW